jgi:competence protein ComEC
MVWPNIERIDENKGNIVYDFLFSFKEKIQEKMTSFMSPPQSALLEALFFGDEGNISQEWKDKFNMTGTRHITAVSGMNITIICALIFNFLLALGLWRNHAFYIAVVFIIFYIIMIGAPASAVRAGIMGIIFMTAQHFGRISAGVRAVAFASVFMLFLNPLLLEFDVGFQLSFLAVLGLVYLQPIFMDIFQKIPNVFQLRFTLVATISAQIFTLPVLILNFGRIHVLSFFSNILIVPTLSFATILGFFYSVIGIFCGFLGQIFSWPAWLILTYVIKVIDLFSKIPFATLQVENISWAWLALIYLLLVFWIWRIKQKQKLKFLEY